MLGGSRLLLDPPGTENGPIIAGKVGRTALLDAGLDVNGCSKAVDGEFCSTALGDEADEDGCCTEALDIEA